jgi:hypothetical protein
MKRVLLISLAATFCVVACGEKSTLQLKARQMRESQQKPGGGTNPSEKTGDPDASDGALNMPTNTSNRKMLTNGNSIRNIFIGAEGMTTTVFCAENLAQSQKEKERIKLQGKSQIILRQVVTMDVPEASSLNPKTDKEAPKSLVSLACLGTSADLDKEPADENVTIIKLAAGKNTNVTGKFSSIVTDHESKAMITCVTAKDMAKANSILLPDDASKASDILMAANSKVLIETASKDKDVKKYILVTCDEATAP